MKERMSRNHKARKDFKVDSLLTIMTNKQRVEAEKHGCPNNFMTIIFLGFYNKAVVEEEFVEIEVVISQISHMKRKDSFKARKEWVQSHFSLLCVDKPINDSHIVGGLGAC